MGVVRGMATLHDLMMRVNLPNLDLSSLSSSFYKLLGFIHKLLHSHACYNYPARACAARGKVISRGWVVVSIKNLQFFLENQSFISQNTHFHSSISRQIGFSSNSMASDTA